MGKAVLTASNPLQLSKAEIATLKAIFAHKTLDLPTGDVIQVLKKIDSSFKSSVIVKGNEHQVSFIKKSLPTGETILPVFILNGSVHKDKLRALAKNLIFCGYVTQDQLRNYGIESAHFQSLQSALPKAAPATAQPVVQRNKYIKSSLIHEFIADPKSLTTLAAFVRTSSFSHWEDLQRGFVRLSPAKDVVAPNRDQLLLLARLLGVDAHCRAPLPDESAEEFLFHPFSDNAANELLPLVRGALKHEMPVFSWNGLEDLLQARLAALQPKPVRGHFVPAAPMTTAPQPGNTAPQTVEMGEAQKRKQHINAVLAQRFSWDGDAIVIPAGFDIDTDRFMNNGPMDPCRASMYKPLANSMLLSGSQSELEQDFACRTNFLAQIDRPFNMQKFERERDGIFGCRHELAVVVALGMGIVTYDPLHAAPVVRVTKDITANEARATMRAYHEKFMNDLRQSKMKGKEGTASQDHFLHCLSTLTMPSAMERGHLAEMRATIMDGFKKYPGIARLIGSDDYITAVREGSQRYMANYTPPKQPLRPQQVEGQLPMVLILLSRGMDFRDVGASL